ncbi:hypothetical protein [Sphingomicrobium nitratireducens]|uniref:hypothetical protein n=1 Tax=Sphingomicrobium nitratireducens TaxID=2964666 RepID=UPI00223F5F9F|nr:hypothetical protein [Sphingomicrobium nitratireducens]
MSEPQLTGWLLVGFGLYSIAASIGELRHPGRWKAMIEELNAKPGFAFIVGLLVFSLGFALSLVHPLAPADGWRSVLVTLIAYGMVLEGLSFLAFPQSMSGLAARLMTAANPLWVVIAAILGLLFLVAGFPLVF